MDVPLVIGKDIWSWELVNYIESTSRPLPAVPYMPIEVLNIYLKYIWLTPYHLHHVNHIFFELITPWLPGRSSSPPNLYNNVAHAYNFTWRRIPVADSPGGTVSVQTATATSRRCAFYLDTDLEPKTLQGGGRGGVDAVYSNLCCSDTHSCKFTCSN